MIKIVGADVPLAALSEFVLRLHEARENGLATRLGRAIDSGSNAIALAPREQAELLDALQRHPVLGLDDLRVRLLDRSRGRAMV